MIITIKPKILFDLLKSKGKDRLVHTRLPDRRDPAIDDRSISTLETACLLTLQKIVGATTIFEFGTALGATTLNMALNTKGIVRTLDLPPAEAAQSVELSPWGSSRANQDAIASHLREWDGIAENVLQVYGNSVAFDFSRYHNSSDLVWIDGGHDYEIVKSDSNNALEMLRKNALACIAWHDCYEPIAPGVARCLEELPHDVYHVGGTVLAFWFNRPMEGL
jgi:hypothetical protein